MTHVDKRTLLLRLANLKKLGLLDALNVSEEAVRRGIEEDQVSPPDSLSSRYLIIKESSYDGQADDILVEKCETLEQAQAEVEDWVFTEAGPGYEFTAAVYDLHLGKEHDYEVVRQIRFKFEKPNEGPAPNSPVRDGRTGALAVNGIGPIRYNIGNPWNRNHASIPQPLIGGGQEYATNAVAGFIPVDHRAMVGLADDAKDKEKEKPKPATPAEEFQALVNEHQKVTNDALRVLREAKTPEDGPRLWTAIARSRRISCRRCWNLPRSTARNQWPAKRVFGC